MRKVINTTEMVGNTYGRLTVVSTCDKTNKLDSLRVTYPDIDQVIFDNIEEFILNLK